jgi:hypothetical protein
MAQIGRHPAALVAALIGALVLLVVGVQVASGQAEGSRGTQLISKTAGGSNSNGAASEPVISQDKRTAKYYAYTSAASDIAPGSGTAVRNVYLVPRKGPFASNGTPWEAGATQLASAARSGVPDGDSFSPALNGDDLAGASCLAFGSAASNLVGGDTNGHADAFVKKLPSGALKRIAAPGAVTQVKVDRKCEDVLYSTSAGIYKQKLKGNGSAKGRPHRILNGGVSSFDVDDQGRAFAFVRGGSVFCSTGGGAKRLASGSAVSVSGSGKYVGYESGGNVYSSHLCGGGQVVHAGSGPSETLAGHYTTYVSGNQVFVPTINHPLVTCPNAPSSPSISGHGNYLAVICADATGVPQAYLTYIGPQ